MSLFKEFEIEVEEYTLPGMDVGDDVPHIREFRFKPLAYVETDPTLLAEAKGILKEARDKAQYLERQAYEEGFQQGQKDGREVGQRSMEQLVQQFQDLVNALVRDREELYRQREKDLIDMVVLISRKIVVRELKMQPEAIQGIVAAGFQLLTDTEDIKLHINPQDYELLQWAPQDAWPPGVEMVQDGTISAGGFLMKTGSGEIDGTLKNRWAMVAQLVQDMLQAGDEHEKAD
ncbi:MAG: FliH/SctL family protein [Desulfobaccales bacterium]